MTWLPNPIVTIGGVVYTSETLWNVSINYGRTTVWEQARASYAQINILNLSNVAVAFLINDTVTITLEDSVGANTTVFTGFVTGIENKITQSGDVAKVLTHQVSAVGSFAFMARKVVGTTAYPKEYDDARINRIFTEAGVSVGVVDTPPVYEFTARAANPEDAYSLAAYYAQMALGYIYETTDGLVNYANESHRTNEVEDYGYYHIENQWILSANIASRQTLNDVTNDIFLTYKANASKTATDAASIALYGLQAASIATELENGTEAQYQADRYILLRSNPQTSLSSFTIQLNTSLMTSVALDVFLNMYMGKPIQVLDLPAGIIDGTYSGFVEGWNLSFNRYEASMTLTTTDSTLSFTPTRWQDVNPLKEWQDIDPAIQWFEYI